ncbi:MAG: sulfatase-like hydrolase/transferase [Anaerolineae bacterium]|nr:sulfatase-like hydrolase/transferase [Anaerolineae bacterium]
MKKTAVLHPFLFAIYPVLTLLAFNINQTSWSQAIRAFTFSLTAALVLILFWYLLTRSWQKAGLLTTMALLLFYAYGHVVRLLNEQLSETNLLNLNLYLTAVWATILIFGSWFIWRVVKRDLIGITRFLNIVIGIALIFPLYTIIAQEISSPSDVQASNTITGSNSSTANTLPDIYYIVSDAYTSDTVLSEIYHFDNTPFIQSLEDQGFYVARGSHSNYSQTLLSLPSTLNMTYLDDLQAQVSPGSEDREPLEKFLRQSELFTFLKEQGYQTVSIASGYAPTELTNFDHFYAADSSLINAFEVMLIKDTWAGSLFSTSLAYETKRRQNLFIFDTLQEVAALPGPKFVFAHATITHFPFVFGPNGERVDPGQDYTMLDGISMSIDETVYSQRYAEQVAFTNQLLQETVAHILATSETPPVIIIQGDHGPELYFDYASLENTCVKERLSIFNAYYLPGIAEELLYETITPVNSFRVVLNSYFDTDLELLEDRSYYATWNRPYDTVDVTDQVAIPCNTDQ